MYSARHRPFLGAGILLVAGLHAACVPEATDGTQDPGNLLNLVTGGNPTGGSGSDPQSGGASTDPTDPTGTTGTTGTTSNNGGASGSGNSNSSTTGGEQGSSGSGSGGGSGTQHVTIVDNRPVTMVTTLDDNSEYWYQPIVGSIRWALQNAPTPGVIRFQVGGAIKLKWTLPVDRPHLEIDGSTAPGGGITFQRRQVEVRDTHDIVLKNLRFRCGDGFKDDAERVAAHGEYYDIYHPLYMGGQRSLVVCGEHGPCRRVRIENCSIQNSTDDNGAVWEDAAEVTFYRCIFSGGYTYATKGLLCGVSPGSPLPSHPQWVTVQQCLFINQWARMPDLNGEAVHLVNNVIIRPMQGGRLSNTKANIVGNCLFSMPNHPWGAAADRVLVAMTGTVGANSLYLNGNLFDGLFDDATKIVGTLNQGPLPLPQSLFRTEPMPGLPANIVSAPEALVQVLSNAGCNGPGRDDIDLEQIDQAASCVGIDPVTVR